MLVVGCSPCLVADGNWLFIAVSCFLAVGCALCVVCCLVSLVAACCSLVVALFVVCCSSCVVGCVLFVVS